MSDAELRKFNFTRKELRDISKLMQNGSVEWLILFLTAKYGTIGNKEIYLHLTDGAAIHPAHLSRARANLEQKGLLKKVRIFNRNSYELHVGLQENIQRLLYSIREIRKSAESNRDFEDLNRLKKKGKIKRRGEKNDNSA